MLISANVDRILWAPTGRTLTRWTAALKVTPLWQVDDGLVFNLLPTWA
jgi:hypothetical protein